MHPQIHSNKLLVAQPPLGLAVEQWRLPKSNAPRRATRHAAAHASSLLQEIERSGLNSKLHPQPTF